MSVRTAFLVVALSAALGIPAATAQQNATTGAHPGAVPQTGAGAVPQSVSPAPLKLTDAQRKRIQDVLTTTHSETAIPKKTGQAGTYKAKVGGKIPRGLHPHGIPRPLITEIPILKQYAYLKVNDQILIVDATDKTIVEIIPEG